MKYRAQYLKLERKISEQVVNVARHIPSKISIPIFIAEKNKLVFRKGMSVQLLDKQWSQYGTSDFP